MNFALFGKSIVPEDICYIQLLVDKLELMDSRLFVHSVWYETLKEAVRFSSAPILFSSQSEIRKKVDYLFSIGGDGTLLDTITLVGDSEIPIIGINMGRLGFLSGISKDEIIPAIDEIMSGQYIIEPRSLLRLETDRNPFGEFNYAMNDVTIYKNRPISILTIKTFINDEFLNTYWADGLIVATP